MLHPKPSLASLHRVAISAAHQGSPDDLVVLPLRSGADVPAARRALHRMLGPLLACYRIGVDAARAGTGFTFVGPAGLPAAVQGKLEKARADTMASAEFRKKLAYIGLTPSCSNGDGLRARIERELPAMRAVAARADIRSD